MRSKLPSALRKGRCANKERTLALIDHELHVALLYREPSFGFTMYLVLNGIGRHACLLGVAAAILTAELLGAGAAARCGAAMANHEGTSMLHTPPFYIALVFAFFLVVTLSFEKVRVPLIKAFLVACYEARLNTSRPELPACAVSGPHQALPGAQKEGELCVALGECRSLGACEPGCLLTCLGWARSCCASMDLLLLMYCIAHDMVVVTRGACSRRWTA